MKKNIDFIYEYSDLNLFQTRVQVLTGIYAGMILEYGGSGIAQWEEVQVHKNVFDFVYTFYKLPDNFIGPLIVDEKMKIFLSNLLISIIAARRTDKRERYKLAEAASIDGMRSSTILIDDKYYSTCRPSADLHVKSVGLSEF